MPLKLQIKPGERFILGRAVVTNSGPATELVVEGDVPVLRGKDVLPLKDAETPCQRIYVAIQLMYVDHPDTDSHRALFTELVEDVLRAAPTTMRFLGPITDEVVGGRYYQALKLARALIDYEAELLTSNPRNNKSASKRSI